MKRQRAKDIPIEERLNHPERGGVRTCPKESPENAKRIELTDKAGTIADIEAYCSKNWLRATVSGRAPNGSDESRRTLSTEHASSMRYDRSECARSLRCKTRRDL